MPARDMRRNYPCMGDDMSELTCEMYDADTQIPCDLVKKRYIIDDKFGDGFWYLWIDNKLIKTGSLDTVTEELRRREG